MRLSISNLAWDPHEDEAIASLLQQYKVDAIDIAPGKYFSNFAEATDGEIVAVKGWWADRGIEIIGMQSLLFGKASLNVFGSSETRAQLLQHLSHVCRIGAALGAPRLVFGSPKNRDRNGLSDAETFDIAIPFFRELGNIAQSHQVMVCLEPNPECYGANFMTNATETAQVVAQIDHPAIRMQFDTGAITINHEEPTTVLQHCADLIGHVHVSEPNLIPIGDVCTDHAKLASAVAKFLPQKIVSIEMLATQTEEHLLSIERALQVVIQHYRDPAITP